MQKRPTHLRAGALLFALLIAVIIGVMTAGLLLILQYNRQYAAHTLRQERLQRHLASATNLLLVSGPVDEKDTLAMSLFGDGLDSVSLIRKPWGVFDVGVAYAHEGRDTLANVFLMGPLPMANERYALYLADEYRPLSISGKTRIQGDAYLPEAGIRKAYIENQAYAGDEVIYGGAIRRSLTELPALNSTVLGRLIPYLQHEDTTSWKRMADDWYSTGGRDSLTQRFAGSPYLLHSRDSLTIAGPPITGQVVLVADSAITVSADALLDNVLLFAPCIRFADGFKGRLQAFAQDSLIIGRECVFAYPSVLGLVNVPKDSLIHEFQPVIKIDSASVVNGLVFSHFPGSEQLLAVIRLEKGTTINGQVYADGLLELKGTVNGVTLCRRFTLQTPSSLYENFVLGGVMDGTRLPPHYGGSPLLNAGRKGKVLAWLDKKTKKERNH
ncbi:hypothetical protein JHJ32_18620 [Parapedobacter sp. ISTM3]|uniref:hypothetical protein n=1 Tax=Parapedobacter sp. ISTM3 TaxID=2800130 RepID=UPI00190708CB|nr:hypothetical protein [Parapedobacter sp. ISTM3]MBK1442019.1 hypothetical protein [Parapedobacter sp. ISTM3]